MARKNLIEARQGLLIEAHGERTNRCIELICRAWPDDRGADSRLM
jgi:hypothetical protein